MMTLKGLRGDPRSVVSYVLNRRERDDSGKQKAGYYQDGATPSVWSGELARELGLKGAVSEKDLRALLSGETPDGEQFAKPSHSRRMGVDCTFSAPKGVSLAALASDLPQSQKDAIIQAHGRAVARAQAAVEREFLCARYGKGGHEVVRTGKAVWATFTHEDARPVNGVVAPQLHSHGLLINVTRGVGGNLRALDLQFGQDGVKLAGAIYQSELASEMRGLGYDLRRTQDGGWDLASVTDSQIEAASPRSAQIETDLAHKGLDRESASAAQKTASNLATRESKLQLSQEDQRWEWRHLAREIGLQIEAPIADRGLALPLDRDIMTVTDALRYATSHLSERESVINGQSTRLHALRAGVLDGVTIDTLNNEIARARASGALIDAGPGRLVTRETLQREALILAAISTAPPIAPLATPEAAAARIAAREAAQGFSFSTSQRVAILDSLSAATQYHGIVGAAGAGKTTAIAAIVDEARAQGLQVVGLGPSQTAADGLKEAGADECRTLASFIAREQDPDAGPRLIVLDEAGMVSARDMQAFLEKLTLEDRVLFVGDPRQLSAVEAGSPFAQMMKEGVLHYSTIDEITRQKDEGLLAVAQAFADGRNDEAVELADPYMSAVTVTDADWKAAGVEKVLEKDVDKAPKIPPAVRAAAIARETAQAYLALSPEEREKTLVMAGTHIIRRSINAHIRAGLQESGAVSHDSVTVTALDKSTLTRAQLREAINYEPDQILRVPEGRGAARKVVDWKILDIDPTRNTLRARDGEGREQVFKARDLDPQKSALYTPRALDLAPGDRVLFTENNRTSGFQNNETGRVLTATPEKIEIEKDNGDRVTLDPTQAATVDYGWGITVHRSQGRTIDRALVAGMSSKVATAQSAYVACSRERWHLQVVTDDKDRLKSAWSRVADRETARDATAAASTAQEKTTLDEARAHIRAEMPEPTPEREPEREPEPAPPRREKERERELGDDFCL